MTLMETKEDLECIIYDVFTPANCDYAVHTFSSNVCRLVFESILINTRIYGDRTTHIWALDAIYTILVQIGRTWSVVGSTIEGEFKKGDRFVVYDNIWNESLKTADGKLSFCLHFERRYRSTPR